MAKPSDFDTNVFINCPFDGIYTPLLRSIVFTVLACGFTPLSALQKRDGGEVRLDKIKRLIRSSRLGIHDISRTDADVGSGLPRFNMPFELGLDLGAKEYGKTYLCTKHTLIFDTERYRYQQFLSDIAGQDISAHHAAPSIAMGKVRDWLNSLRTSHTPPLASPATLQQQYAIFLAELPLICDRVGLDEPDLDFNDFLYFAVEWIALIV
jgi:hypothetical protein